MKFKYQATSTLVIFGGLLVGIFMLSKIGEVATSIQTAAVADFNSSLVAHYTFDEGTGTAAGDSIGSNTASISGATWVDGKIGKALQFDGVDDVVLTNKNLISAYPVTGCAWIYPTSLEYSSTIINNAAFEFSINLGSPAYLTIYNNVKQINSPHTISFNSWQHVCATVDGENIARLYINGTEVRSGTLSAPIFSDAVAIGRRVDKHYPFAGMIDDVRIYNKALNQAQVQELFSAGGGSVPPQATPDPIVTPPTSSTPPITIPTVPANNPVGPRTISVVDASGSPSCEHELVQAAVTSARDGDRVVVGAGSCTWPSAITWTDKNIIFMGAGIDKTIITTTKGGLNIIATTKASFRVSGLTFTGTPSGHPHVLEISSSRSSTPVKGWRVDHVRLNYPVENSVTGFFITGISWGVIDHCVFDGKGYGVIESASYTEAEYPTPPKGIGAYSWDWPLNLGTDEAVYAEDNVWNFTSDTISAVNDQVYGARQVFRHNTINHAFIQTHSTRANDRGGLKYEIYDNIFNGTGFIWPMFFRSGTGVIFNNTITGYSTNNIIVDNQRSCIAYTGKFPRCDGNSLVDGNVPGESGWPCLDQIGRGPGTFGNQPSVPLYAWNNGSAQIKVNGNFDLCLNPGASQTLATHIKSTPHSNGEVDFVNNGTTAKPGYTPYTYPHPLTLSGFTSDAGGPIITMPVVIVPPVITPPIVPVTPPVVPAVIPPVVPQLPIVPAQLPVTPTTPVTTVTPAVPSIISRILPSFTSPTRNPTTPSSVTTRRTNVSGPFVPLPENTPEDIASSSEQTSFTATIKDILSYILERIWRGVERVLGR